METKSKLDKAIEIIKNPAGLHDQKWSFYLGPKQHKFIHLRNAGAWESNPPICASCNKPKEDPCHGV